MIRCLHLLIFYCQYPLLKPKYSPAMNKTFNFKNEFCVVTGNRGVWKDVFNDTMTHFDDLGDLSDSTNQVIKATKMTADITHKAIKKSLYVCLG